MFQIMITVNLRQGKNKLLTQFEIVEPDQIFFHKMQMFAPLGIHLHSSHIVIFCDEYLKFMSLNCVLKQFSL